MPESALSASGGAKPKAWFGGIFARRKPAAGTTGSSGTAGDKGGAFADDAFAALVANDAEDDDVVLDDLVSDSIQVINKLRLA